MSTSILSHVAQIAGGGVPLLPVVNSILVTIAGLAALTVWFVDVED